MNLYGQATTLAEQCNTNLYKKFITSDGINYKNGYDKNTTCILRLDLPVFVVNEKAQTMCIDPSFNAIELAQNSAFIATCLTLSAAIAAGWNIDNLLQGSI